LEAQSISKANYRRAITSFRSRFAERNHALNLPGRVQNANLAKAKPRPILRIIDSLLRLWEHMLDTGGFKTFPAPRVRTRTTSVRVSYVFSCVGHKLDTPEQKVIDQWLHNRYHAPSDDLQQPINFETAGKYENLVWDLLAFTADNEKTPEWKPDSFFRRFAQHQ